MSDAPTNRPAWDENLLRNPHGAADKRERVRRMFAAIAPSYDLNNRLHSLWQDQRWRRQAVKLANLKPTDVVVDVACGTGDLTIAFATALHRLAAPLLGRCMGIDFTYEMLPLARVKSRGHFPTRLIITRPPADADEDAGSSYRYSDPPVTFVNGDALVLPLTNASVDVVSIAFGIRNVQDSAAALREFHRVLRPAGRVIILEFSLPTNRILRALYNFYFRQILPRTATLISRDKTGAYKYLPESVNTFITCESMIQLMRDAGFENVEQFPMTFGVCVCYRGIKH